VYTAQSAKSKMRPSNRTDRDRAARLIVHSDRFRKLPVTWRFSHVPDVCRCRIAVKVNQVNDTLLINCRLRLQPAIRHFQ
jgi:hypothetical protein